MRGVAGIFIGLVLWLLPSFGCLGQIELHAPEGVGRAAGGIFPHP